MWPLNFGAALMALASESPPLGWLKIDSQSRPSQATVMIMAKSGFFLCEIGGREMGSLAHMERFLLLLLFFYSVPLFFVAKCVK